MNKYPQSIINLIESFKLLPGIGEKTAERLMYNILNMSDDEVKVFSQNLLDVKNKIKKCEVCHNLTETNKCSVCCDDNRENILCIIENPKNLMLIEKSGTFYGKYHCIDGLISPMDGVNIDNLNIFSLLERVKTENIKEVIFALKPGIEGDTTKLYITRILKDINIKISALAQGLPVGTDMDYIDNLTLETAIINRKVVE